ncbi:MAG: hypothetical protein KDC83_05345 [Flavobacteriales bacterium]|nr:hypothetical protein [Flavobacteriales bacterium]
MRKKSHVVLFVLVLASISLSGQNVLIDDNGGAPDSSAQLEVKSTSKGVLVPRMTNAQMNAISSPATGLLIFNSTNGSFYFYNGSAWVNLSEDNLGDHTATENIQLDGNYLSNDGGNEGLSISNSGVGTFSGNLLMPNGYLGIGTSSPSGQLTIFGDTSNALTLQSSNNVLSHGIAFQNSGAAYTWNIRRENVGGNQADLVFRGGAANSDINALDERMRIDQNGNLGIGTSDPHNQVHINSSASSSWLQITNSSTGSSSTDGFRLGTTGLNTYFQGYEVGNLYFRTSNSDRMMISSTGYIGIGTNSPSAFLHIQDNADAEIWLEADADNVTETDNPMLRFRQDASSVGMNVGFDDSSFGSNNFGIGRRWSNTDESPSIVVEAQTGHVGISNTNPTSELDISGKTITQDLKVTTGAAANKVLVSDADGDATWQDVPSKTNTIAFPVHLYSNDVLYSGTTFGTYSWGRRYVQFDDVNTDDLSLTFLAPADRTSNNFTAVIYYTSDDNSGNFRMFMAFENFAEGDVVSGAPGGVLNTIPAPSTVDAVKIWNKSFSVGTGSNYVTFIIRRSGGDALDTSTGKLRILGINIEYEN